MDEDLQERIRRRAHELWERDGRPEGKHDEHWAQAEAEVRAEQGGARVTAGRTRPVAAKTAAAKPATAKPAAPKATTARTGRTKGAAAQPAPAGDPGKTSTKSASPAATAGAAKRATKAGTRAAAEDLSVMAEGTGDGPRGRGARPRR